MNNGVWNFIRSTHKWLAIIIALPVLFVIITGIILQVRKPVDYIQPNLHRGTAQYQPMASFETLLNSVKQHSEMGVSGWQDVQLLDLRPKAGTVKIRTHSSMEAQLDAKTAEVLNVQQRWNDIITKMHEGSTWGLRTTVFLISGLFMALLTVTGCFLIYRTLKAKLKIRRKRAAKLEIEQTQANANFPKRFDFTEFCRKYHFYLAIPVFLPWLVVSFSGLMLQVRYEVPWIMPERAQGISTTPSIAFTDVLEKVKKIKGLEVDKWKNIHRVYVYPNEGNISVRTKKRWQVQFDAETGELLDLSVRRTDLIEDIHEGKWLGANLWFFLPAHILSIVFWFFGVSLWVKQQWPSRKPVRKKESYVSG